MNRWLKVGLGVLAGAVLVGAAFVAGRKFLAGNKPPVVLKKQDEKGRVLKGQVVKYDIVSLTVAIDGGSEMNFPDLTKVSVWVIKDGRPQKSDWSKVTVGQRVSLSMDKPGQKLISIIIL